MEVRKWKDFPKDGVTFIDINTILENPDLYKHIIAEICGMVELESGNIAIVSPESRAHFFSAPVSYMMSLPIINLRKQGKYPEKESIPITYNTEYSSSIIYAPKTDYSKYDTFIVIDDLCATGQSFAGIKEFLNKQNPDAKVVYITAIDLKYIHQPIEGHKSILVLYSQHQDEFGWSHDLVQQEEE